MKVVVAGLLSDSFLEDLRASFPNVLFQPASTSEEHKFDSLVKTRFEEVPAI